MSIRRRETRRSRELSSSSAGERPPKITYEKVQVEKISRHTWFEALNYKLDVLVPLNEETELLVPMDGYLQQVHYDKIHKWRVKKDLNYNLPAYLKESRELERVYTVYSEKKSFFGPLSLGSPFLKKWDTLAFVLLFFTASVTPFETAYMPHGSISHVDLLYIMNRFVDVIFFIDIFVQCRTPYRNTETGKLVMDVRTITMHYLRTWFPLDIISVLPFEFLTPLLENGKDLSQLNLLRFFRLTRLFKLLRVFRASRKLKQAKIASGLRYMTMQLLTFFVVVIFLIHWLACGYRLVGEHGDGDEEGWLDHFRKAHNVTDEYSISHYFAGVYWSAATVTLVGSQDPSVAPTAMREYVYSSICSMLSFFVAIYFISSLCAAVHLANEDQIKQDITLDNYLEMFDALRLDTRLKFTVAQHLVDHFATEANEKQAGMLRSLPKSLHCFIAMEVHLDFVLRIPFFEVFVDRQPLLIQELCQGIEKRNIPQNNFLFEDGEDGIYFIDQGIVAWNNYVYPSSSIIGITCLRDQIKRTECRALVDVACIVIPRAFLLSLLEKFPKVRYYCKRWTTWEVLREYIRVYTKLYMLAARRGALMSPPLLSRRPNMDEGEEDDIDIAVLDHMQEMGF